MPRRIVILLIALAAPCLAVEPAAEPAALWREPATGMEFVWVPGGALKPLSGPIARDPYYGDDPDRLPRVAGFWLGRFEVTQGQWRSVMGGNPSAAQKGDDFPVERVSLPEAREFAARLSAGGTGAFRLPTEPEWEFAARSGGGPERYAGGGKADRVAWHKGNSRGATHRVGGKAPNGLGLHDMSGNVWEWCAGEAAGSASAPADPLAELLAAQRGGGFADAPVPVDRARLGRGTPDYRLPDLGLRLVRLP